MTEELIRKAAAGDDDAEEQLHELGRADPARLAPHHGLMLDLGLFYPPTVYRAADADTVRRVVDLVDGGEQPDSLSRLLLILAHSGHPLAVEALRRWATRPPAGSDALHVGPLSYALEGGWTVDAAGNRRDLCSDTAYEWHLRDGSPVVADTCPWCRSPLWTAADLDSAGPAGAGLAHTGWSGRLVFRTCHFCSCYATLYSQVTPNGTATWWTGNVRPDHIGDASPEDPPTLLPVVGPPRPNPFGASAWDRGGSTLGGRPDWIQDADHPDCPGCAQPMDYVGLIGGTDLDEYGEGAYYLHLHCGFTAVNYQQS